MDIIERSEGAGTTLAVTRSLDRTNVLDLDRSLGQVFDRDDGPVWLDVSALRAVDSAGLTLMLKWHRRALAEGRRFAVVRAGEYHRKLLEITRLDQELVVWDRPGGRRLRPLPPRGLARRTRPAAPEPDEAAISLPEGALITIG